MHLLGHVDVDGHVGITHLGEQGVYGFGRGRAQRVDGQARIHQRAATGLYRGLQPGNQVGCAGKAALVWPQRGLGKAGALVQHGQHGQAQACVGGCIGHGPGHGGFVRIGLAVGLVVQVVELAHLCVAALQLLYIQLRRHSAQLRGCDAQRHAVHAVAPRPKVIRRRLAPLGQARKRALEGMAVCVDQARQYRTGQHVGLVGRRGDVGRDVGPVALCVYRQAHVLFPAAVDPGLRCPQALFVHAGLQSTMVRTSARSTGSTAAARAGSIA